ncbi:NADP-dependent oxidoreductase [Kitasatospora sp. NBC_01250]|uniref:NADP-dependent oxidoreductase n=1 Tax=unclassified Kitasatospora TaxID=2633591 RepID=UPI002E0DDCAE|nr:MULTISPECIES: NADP-dependent oxidoreductase [unclassified Kitasatospora]WSJ68428.1 NADP-dependent oxidoreductase [Kitasatospora sp. NBC_01302]
MRAIVQHRFGGPEVLELAEVPKPTPLPTEIVVEVKAAGVNPVETIIRSGGFALLGQPPFTLGWDVSGVVTEVVPGVNRFKVGDEVYGMPFFPRAANAYAEYVAAPSRHFALKPPSLSHVEAAAVPLAGLTAWQGLVDVADVQPGDRVLIHGIAGGVGLFALQIAKARGAYVIGTASAPKHALLREFGADELIDYRTEDFAERVKDVDLVYETIGGDYPYRSLRTLRPGGLLFSAVGRGDRALEAAAEQDGKRFTGISVEPDPVGLEALADLVERGLLRSHVEHALPLEQAWRAHELVATGHTTGKIVLVP